MQRRGTCMKCISTYLIKANKTFSRKVQRKRARRSALTYLKGGYELGNMQLTFSRLASCMTPDVKPVGLHQ